MTERIDATVDKLVAGLSEYIEATYHISHPLLVRQRGDLLREPGVISQRPYFESTPRYRTDRSFAELAELPEAFKQLLNALSAEPRLIFEPPYAHQLEAVRRAVGSGESLVVMTGTGSGKTESFLLPLMGKLVREAAESPARFHDMPAMRCLVLYPMNALVNDQLARLRLLFGDPRTKDSVMRLAGRPIRFARYTSRTLYPGVRTREKDQRNLKAIETYYLRLLEAGPAERALATELQRRGKWPVKDDLRAWYGQPNQRWTDKNGDFIRAILRPGDVELITRHEVQATPPDILVTNYSMLEYMLMRPLERPIFNATRRWLAACPSESFLLIIDEAHLYRGAGGAEVAYLIRRLANRLGIDGQRLQVICTSASFNEPRSAERFAASLTGKRPQDIVAITGNLALRSPAGPGSADDARLLASIDLDKFYSAEAEATRLDVIRKWLEYAGCKETSAERALYESLAAYPPLGELVNQTMRRAWRTDALESQLFPTAEPDVRARATAVLMGLASYARKAAAEPSLLPARVHAFFRGLPGLWVCMDPECSVLPRERRGGPCGRLYNQPLTECECGARVLELYTCRSCGAAYARAYTDDVVSPTFVWSEPGEEFRDSSGILVEQRPIDLLLEEPTVVESVEPADYDLVTGRLNPRHMPERTRTVYLRRERTAPAKASKGGDSGLQERMGEFIPCGVCGESANFGRSSVQDHQTKGDQPFLALVARQLEVQAPGQKASDFAPNRGRKVLIFSDSRQVAARLAPTLQSYATQDLLRPLLALGFARLVAHPSVARRVTLRDAYLAALIGAAQLRVVLRPEVKPHETFAPFDKVRFAVKSGVLDDAEALNDLREDVRDVPPPESLLLGLHTTFTDGYYGLQALALGFLRERDGDRELIEGLPDLGDVITRKEQKIALARTWLSSWRKQGIWFPSSPAEWIGNRIKTHSGRFQSIKHTLDSKLEKEFIKAWLDTLLTQFCEPVGKGEHRLLAASMSFGLNTAWAYCRTCKTPDIDLPNVSKCPHCGARERSVIDPMTDEVFRARKGYYRSTTMAALASPPEAPLGIIAAEHTAQIGSAQGEEIYSLAEEHELLFQDVDLGPDERGRARAAIDVLSCTTTMEVGIDIGQLSGVALRNMPPGRANYQQRAGRAGRRGTSVASVIALAGADSHDNHYFAEPDELVKGQPPDPSLTLDNEEIARRHVLAFLLQSYLRDKLPAEASEVYAQLFEVLGSVEGFRDPSSTINREDFAAWLAAEGADLRKQASSWLPTELSPESRSALIEGLAAWPLALIDRAIGVVGPKGPSEVSQ